MKKTTAEQALAALKNCADSVDVHDAITALELDIAQAVEPVGYFIKLDEYAQVSLEYRHDDDVFPLYGAPQAPAAPDVNAELLEALKYARRMVNASECDIAYIDAAIANAGGAA